MAATACVWSGVATRTASTRFSMASNILRKSWNVLALGNFCNVPSARLVSTSHSATMFSPLNWPISAAPWPPTPMPAMFSFSLGEVRPLTATAQRGTMVTEARPAALVPRNRRRVRKRFCIKSLPERQRMSLEYGPSQKICNVGQVANLPKTRQIDNLPHVGMLHIYCDGPYIAHAAAVVSFNPEPAATVAPLATPSPLAPG